VPKSYARRPIGKLPAGRNPTGRTVAINKWADAILEGTAGGYESDIKMAYIAGRNLLNQFGDIAKSARALRQLEFVVVHEHFMTPTAKFADILLPITTWFEDEDIAVGRTHAIYMPQIIEPMYECRCDLSIFTELSQRLGIEGYSGKTHEEWLRSFCEGSDIEDFERFQREGVFYFERGDPYIAFREQIEDPANHPFPTPSGKIELYSPRLAARGQPDIVPAIPKYVRPWESPEDPLAERYPLQLITPHYKKATHSTLTNLPWLQELEPHAVWMNSADAAARGIVDEDTVRVFNDRGEVRMPVKVTERIMPGVVCIYQGVWYTPDGEGIDRSGCANVLTRDEDTPVADGSTTHSCLVQVGRL
jgi:anaerobic dimethyl sulfoxide reductase subunit A